MVSFVFEIQINVARHSRYLQSLILLIQCLSSLKRMIIQSDPQSPATVYAERRAARLAAVEALAGRLDRLSYARLAAFLLAVALAGVGFGTDVLSPWFALLPLACDETSASVNCATLQSTTAS